MKIYYLSNENILTEEKCSIEWKRVLWNENIISNEKYFYRMKIYFFYQKNIFYGMEIYLLSNKNMSLSKNLFFIE